MIMGAAFLSRATFFFYLSLSPRPHIISIPFASFSCAKLLQRLAPFFAQRNRKRKQKKEIICGQRRKAGRIGKKEKESEECSANDYFSLSLGKSFFHASLPIFSFILSPLINSFFFIPRLYFFIFAQALKGKEKEIKGAREERNELLSGGYYLCCRLKPIRVRRIAQVKGKYYAPKRMKRKKALSFPILRSYSFNPRGFNRQHR